MRWINNLIKHKNVNRREINSENKLAKLYNELGSKIVSAIPADWEKVYYLGEVAADKASWSSVFYFKEVSSNEFIKSHNIPEKYNVSEEIYEQLMDEASEILLKMYDCFIENNQEPWEQLSMFVNETGDFDIDYLYSTISNNDKGPLEREIIWAYEKFGNMPKEGSYTRELLNNYLGTKGQ